MAEDYSKKPWVKIPIEEIKTPKAGKACYGPAWWVVTPDDCVLKFRGHSFQCNTDKAIVEYLIAKTHHRCRAEFIEMAFVSKN